MPEKILLQKMSETSLPMSYFRSSVGLDLTIKSLTHFEFILV